MDTKEKILAAVIEMLRTQSEEEITMRGIAQKVGITLSVINYHFQSKQTLIELAIKRMITAQMVYINVCIERMRDEPLFDKLLVVWNMIADYMASEQQFARISILSDFRSEHGAIDNSFQVHMRLKELIIKEAGMPIEEAEINLLLHQMGSALQVMFLRANMFMEQFHIDFFDARQRSKAVNQMVSSIFRDRV